MSPSHNLFLDSLSPSDRGLIPSRLKVIELAQETVLFEVGSEIKKVYFPHEGVVSLVVPLASGEMIESAMIGRDGLVGGACEHLAHPHVPLAAFSWKTGERLTSS